MIVTRFRIRKTSTKKTMIRINKYLVFLVIYLFGITSGFVAFNFTYESMVSNSIEANSYLKFKKIKDSFVPSGVPRAYGKELDVSFDEVDFAINRISNYGPTYGEEKIVLADNDLKRYIDIGSLISCEYCCEAKTLVEANGEAACGCQHSIMMRGLTAYLITNYPEKSNEFILNELGQWKRIFFPKQTLTAHLEELEKAGEPGIQEIIEEFPEFMPEMVGSC